MTRRIGAHLSVSGGYNRALSSIVEKGGNALQIFSTSPRIWEPAVVSDEDATAFRKEKEAFDISPVFFHASYLVNLADDGRIGHISKKALIAELRLQPRMGVRGSVIHLGSYKDKEKQDTLFVEERAKKYETLLENTREILAETPEESLFIIENVATRKIGRLLDELAQIVSDLNNPRVKVCLDTCHLHAAGYDLSTAEKLEAFLNEFDTKIGLDKIELFHLNDSRDPFGSMRDRHDNLGQGEVPESVFKLLLNHSKLTHIPFILETPGFDKKGPDKQNIAIAKGYIAAKPTSHTASKKRQSSLTVK